MASNGGHRHGKVRVNKIDQPGFDLVATVKTSGMGIFQDRLSAFSWLPTEEGKHNPTVVGCIDKSRQIAFYRIRHKKDAHQKATTNISREYELIELVKRRFYISAKLEENAKVTDCLADQSHPNNCLVITKPNQPQQKPQHHCLEC
jgi:hypothetical protein